MFWDVLLNPFWTQSFWGAGQVCSQQHRWGCISWSTPVPLPGPPTGRNSMFPTTLNCLHLSPARLLACSIDPVLHESSIISSANAGWRLSTALCYKLPGSAHAGTVLLPIEWFYSGPYHDPSPCLNKWRTGTATCPGPTSDRDLTRFCGWRLTLTRTQNCRDWLCNEGHKTEFEASIYSKLLQTVDPSQYHWISGTWLQAESQTHWNPPHLRTVGCKTCCSST